MSFLHVSRGAVRSPAAAPSAADRVYATVADAIISGTLDASSLITEGEIAESLSISRTPVREAFLELQAHGLLTLFPPKLIASVRIVFPDGQTRATVRGEGGAVIERAQATLPPDIQRQLTRKRKAGQEDAAIDPLSLPDVKAAVARASFELLIGFQLTADQLQYNATR